MEISDSMWSRKGATLSDKSARKEYGLTQQEIILAIQAGKLQFRESSMHGNPWCRLLRQEVESLVQSKNGNERLLKTKLQKELSDPLQKVCRPIQERTQSIMTSNLFTVQCRFHSFANVSSLPIRYQDQHALE